MSAEEKIGYMNPPKSSQFKPGQSGNKSGRPKGSKNTYKLLDDLLNKKVPIVQDGKSIKTTRKTLILMQTVNSASKGDMKAIQTIFPHMLAVDTRNESLEAIKEHLSIDDKKIIEIFLEQNKDITKEETNDESNIKSNP